MSLITKYEFEVPEEGIKLLILAAVHGNETAGTKACNRLMAELNSGMVTLKKGFLTIVPVCNPEAYRKDVRCVEENLNRVMTFHENPQTYEQRLANEICPLIKRSRVTLDLHSTHCPGDVPFAFCDYPDKYNQMLINALDVEYVLEGWPEIYGRQQQITDYSTEHCAHAYGKTATTLECGYHKAPEAAELAYFGAKILHPSSVQPAKKENIPVRLKNTLCPDDEGTLITEDSPAKNVKAVAAKSGITAIKIKSTNMLLAYGFLRKVFEVFEAWKTPIDMIATSEVAVSLTIDCTEHLEEILKDLEKYGTIEVDRNMAIVCIVGDFSAGKSGLGAQVLKALEEVPLRMISYGGSAHNISVLVKEEDKKKAMTDLSHKLEDLQH